MVYQFAGVVSNIAVTTVDSPSQQQATSATEGIATPQLQVGDHVLGACRFGSYTTCLNVPAQQVLTSCPLENVKQQVHGAVVMPLLFAAAKAYTCCLAVSSYRMLSGGNSPTNVRCNSAA